jgi:hypothetical protein
MCAIHFFTLRLKHWLFKNKSEIIFKWASELLPSNVLPKNKEHSLLWVLDTKIPPNKEYFSCRRLKGKCLELEEVVANVSVCGGVLVYAYIKNTTYTHSDLRGLTEERQKASVVWTFEVTGQKVGRGGWERNKWEWRVEECSPPRVGSCTRVTMAVTAISIRTDEHRSHCAPTNYVDSAHS